MSAAIGYREGGIGAGGDTGCKAGSRKDGGLFEPIEGDTILCGGLATDEIGEVAFSTSGCGLSGCVAAAAASCKRRR